MSTETKETNFFGQIIDGVSKQYGLKDGAPANLTERLAGFASVIIPTVLINDRFRIAPAIKSLPQNQRQAVVEQVPMGRFTIGKM